MRGGCDADDRLKATNLALLATDRDTERAEALLNEMISEARRLGAALARHQGAGKAAAHQREGQLFGEINRSATAVGHIALRQVGRCDSRRGVSLQTVIVLL